MAKSRSDMFSELGNTVTSSSGAIADGTGTNWAAGISFKRSKGLPLDKYSVFKTLNDAQNYASKNSAAYPGQVISVVPESGETRIYCIQTDGTLLRLGINDDNQRIKAKNSGTDVTFGSNEVVEIKAGTNVTVSASGTDKTITIASTDTGATSIDTTGSGNAVTSASYSGSNRKITLTKGKTFLESVPNASDTATGGIKIRYDSGILYITNNGNNA